MPPPARQFVESCKDVLVSRYSDAISDSVREEERKAAQLMHSYTYADVSSTAAASWKPTLSLPGLEVRHVLLLPWLRVTDCLPPPFPHARRVSWPTYG